MHLCSHIHNHSIPWQQKAAPSNKNWHTAYRASPPTLIPYQTCEGGETETLCQKKNNDNGWQLSARLHCFIWSLPHVLLDSRISIRMLFFFFSWTFITARWNKQRFCLCGCSLRTALSTRLCVKNIPPAPYSSDNSGVSHRLWETPGNKISSTRAPISARQKMVKQLPRRHHSGHILKNKSPPKQRGVESHFLSLVTPRRKGEFRADKDWRTTEHIYWQEG